jgi:hypothetical protein
MSIVLFVQAQSNVIITVVRRSLMIMTDDKYSRSYKQAR